MSKTEINKIGFNCVAFAVIAFLALLVGVAGFGNIKAYAEEKNKYYISLGDSIAEGTALPDAKKQCYTSLLGEELDGKLKTVNYGVAMKTSSELLEWLSSIGEDEREKLRNAGIVTVSIGSNDVLLPFIYYVPEVFECDWDGLDSAIAKTILGGKGEIQKRVERMKKILEEDVNRKDGIEAGLKTLKGNLPLIVSKLRELAPEAEIYFANYYNPYDGVAFPGFDMGEMGEAYISRMNELWEDIPGDYTLLDVHSMFKGKKGILNVNIMSAQFDPHPNIEGHKLLAAMYMEKMQEGKCFEEISFFRDENLFYRVLNTKRPSVSVYQRLSSKKSVKIPKSVSYKGVNYRVSGIESGAFYSQENLKKVEILSPYIKSIGKSGFEGTNDGLKVYVPKKQYKAYKKLLRAAGVDKKAVVKSK